MKVMEKMLKYMNTEYDRIEDIKFYFVFEFCQLFISFNNDI
jgi:hypothetical protein